MFRFQLGELKSTSKINILLLIACNGLELSKFNKWIVPPSLLIVAEKTAHSAVSNRKRRKTTWFTAYSSHRKKNAIHHSESLIRRWTTPFLAMFFYYITNLYIITAFCTSFLSVFFIRHNTQKTAYTTQDIAWNQIS